MYDADMQSFFDSIPYDKLLAVLGRRIADCTNLTLIQNWLKCVIVEDTPAVGPEPLPQSMLRLPSYEFRYLRDEYGRNRHYLYLGASAKAQSARPVRRGGTER